MLNKYNRLNYYKLETVNDKYEYDLINNYWDLFEVKRPMKYVPIVRDYINRPDILSYAIYGDINLWWIICKFNQIDDIWNDLNIGDNINAPDKKDVDDFFLKVYALQKNK